MRVSETMDLKLLAELMGKGTTQEEATVMRQFLLEDKINDTEDVSESVWPQMIRDAVELAEEQEVAMAEAISAGLGRSPEDWETMPAVEPDAGPTDAASRRKAV